MSERHARRSPGCTRVAGQRRRDRGRRGRIVWQAVVHRAAALPVLALLVQREP
jgi:hypothetical protein